MIIFCIIHMGTETSETGIFLKKDKRTIFKKIVYEKTNSLFGHRNGSYYLADIHSIIFAYPEMGYKPYGILSQCRT